MLCSSSVLGDDSGSDQKVTTTIKSVNEEEPNNFPSLLDGNLLRLFTRIFRPVKISGKTYGPNVVVIIGDKPYISMEIFNKFSPFRWLMNVFQVKMTLGAKIHKFIEVIFQGKVQNVCNLLAPFPDDGSFANPENVIQQILQDSQQKPSGK